jgi:hypothetical protein
MDEERRDKESGKLRFKSLHKQFLHHIVNPEVVEVAEAFKL